MILEVHASRIELSSSARAYLERRIEFALGRFEESIRSVSVTLEDTNGPRGGVDQLCRILVSLRGERKPVIAEQTHDQLRAAIDLAAECAGRSVSRTIDRRTHIRHRGSMVELSTV
jgi:ribosome-associated translation inhibitor RaiA